MKRIYVASAAIVLSLSLSALTSGHTSDPILPVDNHLFVEVPYPTPIAPVIVDTFVNQKQHPSRPLVVLPQPSPITVAISTPKPVSKAHFILDPEVSWYGPGFYGKRTACGLAFTKTILGVAHKTLPCGTLVTFMWKGVTVTVPVIDRGPYVSGRQWDLSGGLCLRLNHCFTGPLYYHLADH